MADPVWGQLAKAQDDAQKIDEAIAAGIAAHETDPDAHTGVGESLETHKSQETIDHSAGSVVGDKFSRKEIQLNFPFESIDSWTTGGSYANSFGALLVDLTKTEAEDSYAIGIQSIQATNLLLSRDLLYKESLIVDESSEDYYAMWGIGPDSFNPAWTPWPVGFYFALEDSALYAKFKVGANITSEEIIGYDLSVSHLFSIRYVAADLKAYFYIDGVLVKTIDKPAGAWSGFWGVWHRAKLKAGAGEFDEVHFQFSELFIAFLPS